MVKNHLKSIAAPKTWPIKRKENVFVSKPNSGAHSLKYGVSLSIFFKSLINVCKTTKEVSNVVYHKKVFVDGRQVKDKSYCVGLYDVVKIEATKQSYRIVFTKKGKLAAVLSHEKNSDIKPCKIIGKTVIKKGKIQLNLSDGKNITLKKNEYNIGDTLILEIPSLSVKEHIAIEKGAYIQIVNGKYLGLCGEIVDIIRYESASSDLIVFKTSEGKEISTLKSYAYVLGKKKPLIEMIE